MTPHEVSECRVHDCHEHPVLIPREMRAAGVYTESVEEEANDGSTL